MVRSSWFEIVLVKKKPLGKKKFEYLHQMTHSSGKETQQK